MGLRRHIYLPLALGLLILGVPAWGSETTKENCDPPGTEVRVPLSEVVPQCMAERQPTRDAADLLARDVEVCRCLKERNALFPDALSTNVPARIPPAELLAQSRANNSALTAMSVAGSQEEMSQLLVTSGMPEVRARMNELIDTIKPPQISRDAAKTNDIPESRRDTQCVTYLEYHSQRELPYDNSFFSFLGSTTNFREDDWKMEPLLAAYDAASTDEQRRSILARMTFLSRNANYAALFRASPGERFSAEVVTAKKVEFFNILRRLAPASGSNCAQVANGCWREAQSSGSYGDFSRDALAFYLQNDVADITSSQIASAFIDEANRLAENPSSLIPQTSTGYSLYLQSSQPELAFACSGPTAEASCYEKFGEHCRRVEEIRNRAQRAASGADIVQELSAAETVHGLLNPEQNLSFDAFNDLICLQNYENAAGESSNFFAYRSRMCSGTDDAPECSDRKALLARFLREYSAGGDEGQRSVRAGFADAIGRANFQSLTEAQIDAVNRISESPRALRERFGGGYPTISPRGQIIPPSGSRTPASSRTSTSAPSESAPLTDPARGVSASTTSPESRSPRRESPQPDASRTPETAQIGPTRSGGAAATAPRSSGPIFPGTPSPFTPVPIAQPQASSDVSSGAQRSPASSRTTEPEAPQPSTGIVSSGGAIPAPVSPLLREGGRVLGPEPLVELPPRRTPRRTDALNGALLSRYENVSQNPVTRFQEELLNRPPVSVPTTPDVLAQAMNELSVLSADPGIMGAVNESSEQIVKLSLEVEGASPVVVYATKSSEGVSFSFTPPSPPTGERSPMSLGDNEMNVRLQEDIFQRVSQNPDALREYQNVLRSAMSLPGDVVRLNILSPGQTPIEVYVDKRGATPRFTLSDQNIIRAYRP